MDDVLKVNDRMFSLMGVDGAIFHEICIATSLDESDMSLRKPSPKFARDTMCKYGISCDELFMVGDNLSDVKTAISANCNSIWFSSEWSMPVDKDITYKKMHKVATFQDLTEIINKHYAS